MSRESWPVRRTNNASTTLEARKCSHNYAETGCVTLHMFWSSNSNNKMSETVLHAVEEVETEDSEKVAWVMLAKAHTRTMTALTKLGNFTSKNLEVVPFSGEGNTLHQIFHAL